MDDDLYPNDSFYFPREPRDQVIGRKKERAQTLEGVTELRAIVTRLQDKIAFYESVKSIPEEVKLDPVKFMYVVAGNAVIVEVLEAEKEYIESLLSSHGKD